jgi:hypothetical protein
MKNEETFAKYIFCFFAPFRAQKFAKSANMTQKMFPQIFLIWLSKNAEFYAYFESVKKVPKKCTGRKLQG